MKCPHCGQAESRVIDSRNAGSGIRRRRECQTCNQRFTTYEQIAANLLVVKSDGRREPYDRQKVLQGLRTACTKRPIANDAIEGLVDQVEERLLRLGRVEISSEVIGNLVLDGLKELDQVAYIRFASVYLDLADLQAVRAEIDRLMGR